MNETDSKPIYLQDPTRDKVWHTLAHPEDPDDLRTLCDSRRLFFLKHVSDTIPKGHRACRECREITEKEKERLAIPALDIKGIRYAYKCQKIVNKRDGTTAVCNNRATYRVEYPEGPRFACDTHERAVGQPVESYDDVWFLRFRNDEGRVHWAPMTEWKNFCEDHAYQERFDREGLEPPKKTCICEHCGTEYSRYWDSYIWKTMNPLCPQCDSIREGKSSLNLGIDNFKAAGLSREDIAKIMEEVLSKRSWS